MKRVTQFRIPLAAAVLATAAALPAADLQPQAAQQSQNTGSQATADAGQSGQAGRNASSMMLQGPTGRDVLQITRTPPAQARAGQEVSYSVTVKNISRTPVQNVTVKETFTGGFEVVSAVQKGKQQNQSGQQQSGQDQSGQNQTDQQQGQSAQGQNQGQAGNQARFSRNLGTLAAGESKTIQVTGTAPQEGEVRSCLSADFQPTLCTAFNVVKPNLKLSRRVIVEADNELAGMQNAAYQCDTVAVRYTVKNTGSGESRDVMLMDQLPSGLVTQDGKSKVEQNLGTLAAGASASHEVQLKLAENRNRGGKFTLSPAKAQSKSDTARAGEDTAPLRILKPSLDITIDGPAKQYIDRPVDYTVTVKNTSGDPALNTRVTVQSPQGADRFNVESQNASGNTVNVGRLDGGESRQFKVSMAATQPSKLSTTVTANAYCVDAVEQTIETQVEGIAAILLEVVDQVDPVPVGENTTYEIYVKNQGSAPDDNVELTATIPDAYEFVEATGDSQVERDGNTIRFQKVPTVAPGEVMAWEVTVKAKSAEKVRFRIELTSEANKRPVFELEPTTLY